MFRECQHSLEAQLEQRAAAEQAFLDKYLVAGNKYQHDLNDISYSSAADVHEELRQRWASSRIPHLPQIIFRSITYQCLSCLTLHKAWKENLKHRHQLKGSPWKQDCANTAPRPSRMTRLTYQRTLKMRL